MNEDNIKRMKILDKISIKRKTTIKPLVHNRSLIIFKMILFGLQLIGTHGLISMAQSNNSAQNNTQNNINGILNNMVVSSRDTSNGSSLPKRLRGVSGVNNSMDMRSSIGNTIGNTMHMATSFLSRNLKKSVMEFHDLFIRTNLISESKNDEASSFLAKEKTIMVLNSNDRDQIYIVGDDDKMNLDDLDELVNDEEQKTAISVGIGQQMQLEQKSTPIADARRDLPSQTAAKWRIQKQKSKAQEVSNGFTSNLYGRNGIDLMDITASSKSFMFLDKHFNTNDMKTGYFWMFFFLYSCIIFELCYWNWKMDFSQRHNMCQHSFPFALGCLAPCSQTKMVEVGFNTTRLEKHQETGCPICLCQFISGSSLMAFITYVFYGPLYIYPTIMLIKQQRGITSLLTSTLNSVVPCYAFATNMTGQFVDIHGSCLNLQTSTSKLLDYQKPLQALLSGNIMDFLYLTLIRGTWKEITKILSQTWDAMWNW